MWNIIKSLISASSDSTTSASASSASAPVINPATGLPMISGIGSVDVQGNPYGADLHDSSTVHSSGSMNATSHTGIDTLSNDSFQNPLARSASGLGHDAFSSVSHDPGFSHSTSSHNMFDHSSSSFSNDTWSSSSSFSDDSWNSSSSSFSDNSWSSSSSDFGSSSSWD